MNKLATFFKGMAMGAADVVPGVSGGTIAFITGIYDTLLESIRRINPKLIGIWRKDGIKAAFNYVNGGFLITLLAGILTSILSLAQLITWLLKTHPIPLWSFFFGLILVSILHMLKQVDKWKIDRIISVILGTVVAYGITVWHPIEWQANINIFIAGAIAICAMILPGISGSFILLLLGMYTPILAAAKGLELGTLGIFAMGCVVGILTFSHILSWLLRQHRDVTLTFLTGLMVGTLSKIWPWKETLSTRINSAGETVPLLQHNLSPWQFEHVTGLSPWLVTSVVAMIVAIVFVLLLERFGQKD